MILLINYIAILLLSLCFFSCLIVKLIVNHECPEMFDVAVIIITALFQVTLFIHIFSRMFNNYLRTK